MPLSCNRTFYYFNEKLTYLVLFLKDVMEKLLIKGVNMKNETIIPHSKHLYLSK